MQANPQTKAEIMAGVESVTHSKKVMNNTYQMFMDNGDIIIRYHTTNVVTKKKNGTFILHSGGWKTTTTKERINYMMPAGYYVATIDGTWNICKRGGGVNERFKPIPFVDGINIRKDGTIPKKWITKTEAQRKREEKLDIKIDKYMKIVEKKLQAGDVRPKSGDCWCCLMKNDKGESVFDDNTHVAMHVKEGYVPNILIWNAISELGYNPQFHLTTTPSTQSMRGTVAMKAVRKYVKRRVGLAI